VAAPLRLVRSFRSRGDRAAYESARAVAERATGYRVVVDIGNHRLWVIDGSDTLRNAPVATASNTTLTYGGKSWRFETPLGVRTVLSKDTEPTWTPPEWHYAEVATEHGLRLRQLERGQVVRIRDGTRLMTKGDEVGVIPPGETEFVPLVLDEHVVFDNTLFIPPTGTKLRTVAGELGHFRLKLGDGYMIHGTPFQKSIGTSATHGCVRMTDEDIEWVYHHVPVGTKVYLY
jgi:lipoprotein-anchoring transpeptidase ErfK/SrfK